MEVLTKVKRTLQHAREVSDKKELFQNNQFSGPFSLTEALRLETTPVADNSDKVGWPTTAWWSFVEDFYRPIGRHDLKNLLPDDDEQFPVDDPIFRMPLVGAPEGKRFLPEFWEALGYGTLRRERRSGRLAEKKAFTSGFDVPSGPSDEWLGLPKDFLREKKDLVEICKVQNVVEKMDELLDILKPPGSEKSTEIPTEMPLTRFCHTHPMTQALLEPEKNDFSEHCLAIGPDDEVAAEILKLQELLLKQMTTNRRMAKKLAKTSIKKSKMERKHALKKDRLEKEIAKCQRVIEAHEARKKEESMKREATMTALNTAPNSVHKSDERSCQAIAHSLPAAAVSTALPSVRTTVSNPTRLTTTCPKLCDICGVDAINLPLLMCGHCQVTVHAVCYGISEDIGEDGWWCLPCRIYNERRRQLLIKNTGLKSGGALSVSCKSCPIRGGAYQRTVDSKKWVHTICSIAHSDPATKTKATLGKCNGCGRLKGRVFPCSTPECPNLMHILCAKAHGTLTIVTDHASPEKQHVITILCATCARGESNIPQEKEPSRLQTIQQMRDGEVQAARQIRGNLVKTETSLHSSQCKSEESKASTSHVQDRPRKKTDVTDDVCGRKRGRPKNSQHLRSTSQLKRKESDTEQSFPESKKNRRQTRSMK